MCLRQQKRSVTELYVAQTKEKQPLLGCEDECKTYSFVCTDNLKHKCSWTGPLFLRTLFPLKIHTAFLHSHSTVFRTIPLSPRILTWICRPLRGRVRDRGRYMHMNNCECKTNLCKLRMRKFMRVNKEKIYWLYINKNWCSATSRQIHSILGAHSWFSLVEIFSRWQGINFASFCEIRSRNCYWCGALSNIKHDKDVLGTQKCLEISSI